MPLFAIKAREPLGGRQCEKDTKKKGKKRRILPRTETNITDQKKRPFSLINFYLLQETSIY
jgi:hypothetical protein